MTSSHRTVTSSRQLLATATVLLVGFATAVVGWIYWPTDCDGFFSGMSRTATGECIGIVNSDRVLDPSLKDIFKKFQDANQNVMNTGSNYVKVVLLTPMSVPTNGALPGISLDKIKYSLEGAFTALYRANNSSDFGDPSAIKIQVLLANQGSRQENSDELVKAIVDQDEAEHPVVAVVGLGNSLVGTQTTVKALAEKGIPMVGAVASADGLNSHAVRGLRNISPSNTSYIKALRSYLDNQEQLKSAVVLKSGIVVADTNNDLFTQSLRNAFTSKLTSYVKFPDQTFSGGTIDSNVTPNVFAPIVANLCNAVNDRKTPLDMVFFAGRVADFSAFAKSLENRVCKATPMTVLTAATGFESAQQYADVLAGGNVNVIYATSADPLSWINHGPGTPEGFTPFEKAFQKNRFATSSLVDGYAIAYHDAVASAAAAIRLAAQGVPVPKASDVDNQFENLNLANSVRGASGTLSFPNTTLGRSVGKAVPIRQIDSTKVVLPANIPLYITDLVP